MSFIPVDNDHYVNTKNIDYVGQEIVDGDLIVFVKSGGDRLIVNREHVDTLFNVIRNQDKEEANWAG